MWIVKFLKINEKSVNLIRQDSVAEVVSPTLIGSEYVALVGLSGYPRIEPYHPIPSRERKSVTEHLAELASEENIQKVKHMLINLAKFSEDLKNDEKVLLAALNHLDEVLKNLTEGKGTLGMLVMQKDLYNRLNQALDHMDKFLIEAKILMVDLKPTAEHLGVFTKSINPGDRAFEGHRGEHQGGQRGIARPDGGGHRHGPERQGHHGRHQGQSFDPYDCPQGSQEPNHPCGTSQPSLAAGPGSGWWPCWWAAALPDKTRSGSR